MQLHLNMKFRGEVFMLDRSELKFNDDVVKMFEHLQIDCWNPDSIS